MNKGFTALELVIVIAIIGILSAVTMGYMLRSRASAYEAKAQLEIKSTATALELYQNKYGNYPDDVDRDLPSGLSEFMSDSNTAAGPWPGSIYDWDNWQDPDDSSRRIYQISIRFCETNTTPLNECRFPDEDWA